jgi:hypothetical protein
MSPSHGGFHIVTGKTANNSPVFKIPEAKTKSQCP